MIVYTLNLTDTCQQYNQHEVHHSEEAVKRAFEEAKDNIHRGGDISEVYDENESEFYWEHSEGSARLYWDKHLMNQRTL